MRGKQASSKSRKKKGNDIYEVEKIYNKKTEEDGTVKYLVKWEGYPQSACKFSPKIGQF